MNIKRHEAIGCLQDAIREIEDLDEAGISEDEAMDVFAEQLNDTDGFTVEARAHELCGLLHPALREAFLKGFTDV
jgi:uncharacterized protein YoaH (UPF0181 family)